MDKKAIEKTVFNVGHGHYEYLRMNKEHAIDLS